MLPLCRGRARGSERFTGCPRPNTGKDRGGVSNQHRKEVRAGSGGWAPVSGPVARYGGFQQ